MLVAENCAINRNENFDLDNRKKKKITSKDVYPNLNTLLKVAI